jgi:amidase
MSSGDVLDASALEQARLMREGHVSSEELVRGYLARIDRLDPHLSAFVTVSRRRALLAARWKDMWRRRARRPLPPFHGVPIGVKDMNIVRGMVTRWGSRGALPLVLPFDDLTVRSLRRAGFVILGKMATSELGTMPVTEPDIHPPTRNPWAAERSAGGSSGGSGAAVAAGMLPIAQGTDGAGSIRIPAAFCHLVGLKPSRGRLRNSFGMPERHLLYTSGPITHTVDDAAAMLDVMAGGAEGRPHAAPSPPRPFLALAREQLPRLKVRVSVATPLAPTHPEIAAAVRDAARRLADLGHEVDEGPLPDGSLDEFLPLWQHLIAQFPFMRWKRAQPITRWLAEPGRRRVDREVQAHHEALESRLRASLEAVDVWLTPTVPEPAPLVGAFSGLPPEAAFAAAARLGAFTAVFNLTGLPALTLPLGLTADGLPMGLHVTGRMYAEGHLLALARQIEEILPWRQRRPPAPGAARAD